jgi:small subunit ribosomal protein S6
MRPYEVMIILDPTLEDDAVRAEVDRSTELIRSKGGNPGRVERWGKRRLAYEIRRQREGNYVLLEAEAEPSVMADLDRSLQLADKVLRHKVVRRPDKPAGRPARVLTPTSPADGAPPADTAFPAEPTSLAADQAASTETT